MLDPSPELPPRVSKARLLARLAVIGAILTSAAAAFAWAGGWLSPGLLTPARVIDRFETLNGVHPGFRRNHAKGICVTGWFDSNGAGQRLSKALVFAPGRVPVVGRFALGVGQPYVADAQDTVRSLAVQFMLPDGEQWRTGMNNIPVFAVNTPEGFYEQLAATHPDPATGRPDPAKLNAFLKRHPETPTALKLIQGRTISSGFADSSYNSLDAFHFINADGLSTPVRWSVVPSQSFTSESVSAAANDKNWLFDTLIAQIGQQALQWHLIVTVGHPEDPTSDATIPWPEDREHVDVGTLSLDRAEGEDGGACRDVNYDPLVLPDGIAPSDDPLLSARSATYSQSFTRRAGETKAPSAVVTAGAEP